MAGSSEEEYCDWIATGSRVGWGGGVSPSEAVTQEPALSDISYSRNLSDKYLIYFILRCAFLSDYTLYIYMYYLVVSLFFVLPLLWDWSSTE